MVNKKNEYDFLVPWFDDRVPWHWDNTSAEVFDDYSGGSWVQKKIIWKENKPFKASFKITGFVGTTSSTRVELENTATSKLFIIREPEFIEAMEQLAVVHGVLIGEWVFRKTSGGFFGLKLAF